MEPAPLFIASSKISSSTLTAVSPIAQKVSQCRSWIFQFSSLYFFTPLHLIDFYSFAQNSMRFHRNY